MLLDEDYIKILIADKLYDEDLIDDEVYEKCSKPHISSLPGDLRSNDKNKLNQRKNSAKKKLEDNKKKKEELDNEMKKISIKMEDNRKWTKDSFDNLGKQLKKMQDNFWDGDREDNEDTWQNWGIGSEYNRINVNLDDLTYTFRGMLNEMGNYFNGSRKTITGFNKSKGYAKKILKDLKKASKTQLVPESWVKNAENIILYLENSENYYKMHRNNSKKYSSLKGESDKLEGIISDLDDEISRINDNL